MSNQKGPKYSTPLVGMRGRCHRIMLLPREIVPNLVVLGQTVLAYIEGLQIWKHSRRVGLEVSRLSAGKFVLHMGGGRTFLSICLTYGICWLLVKR